MAKEKDEDWMQKKWRPAMGWMYMIVCMMDMVVFPVGWSLLQALLHQPITQWDPLTLRGAGLFHIAMGAVLGIAAFGRTQEKLAGTAVNPTATVQTTNNNMSGNVSGGFGSNMGNTNVAPMMTPPAPMMTPPAPPAPFVRPPAPPAPIGGDGLPDPVPSFRNRDQ